MCGYVEKYYICGLKVGVCILRGYLRYFPKPSPETCMGDVSCLMGMARVGLEAHIKSTVTLEYFPKTSSDNVFVFMS